MSPDLHELLELGVPQPPRVTDMASLLRMARRRQLRRRVGGVSGAVAGLAIAGAVGMQVVGNGAATSTAAPPVPSRLSTSTNPAAQASRPARSDTSPGFAWLGSFKGTIHQLVVSGQVVALPSSASLAINSGRFDAYDGCNDHTGPVAISRGQVQFAPQWQTDASCTGTAWQAAGATLEGILTSSFRASRSGDVVVLKSSDAQLTMVTESK
jgi:heat shock protein HslJ